MFSSEFPREQYSTQFVGCPGRRRMPRDLRLAICNAKKSGGRRFGVVVSFRLLDVRVCPRHITYAAPPARVTMNHLASRVRHHRLLIESFRRKQDGNLSPETFRETWRFIGEIIYLPDGVQREERERGVRGGAVVSRRARTSRFSSHPTLLRESALIVNMNLQLIPVMSAACAPEREIFDLTFP